MNVPTDHDAPRVLYFGMGIAHGSLEEPGITDIANRASDLQQYLNSRYQGIIVGYGVYDEAGDTFGNYKSFGLLKKYLYTDENFEFENNERPSVSRTHYAAMLMARSAVMAYKDSRGVLVKPQVLYTPHNEHDYLTDLPKSLPETLHIFPQIQAQKSYSLNSEMGVYDRANVSRKGVLDNSATIRNFIASLKKPSN